MQTAEHRTGNEPADEFHARGARRRTRLLLRHMRNVIGDHPVFLPIVLRATPRGTSRRIDDRTDLVVEGYPRSGNTYAAAAIKVAAGPSLVVSSHVHTPSQVVLAVRRQLPTLLVIRRPVESVASLLVAAPHVPIELAIKEWTHHYDVLWPLREGFVAATFEQATGHMGDVIDRINGRFGTSISRLADDEPTNRRISEMMAADHERFHAGEERSAPWPTASRAAAHAWVTAELGHARYAGLLARADSCYARYAASFS